MLFAGFFAAAQILGLPLRMRVTCRRSTSTPGCVCESAQHGVLSAKIGTPDCCSIQQSRPAPSLGAALYLPVSTPVGIVATAPAAVAYVHVAAPRPTIDAGHVHHARPIFLSNCSYRI
jgi:hypothetical protein